MAARAPLSPVLTLAVLLLVAGAALGSWLALAGGWGLAYVSRRLTRAEAKFAALGVPGTVVGGLVVWLWGRFDGRWASPRPGPAGGGNAGRAAGDGAGGGRRLGAVPGVADAADPAVNGRGEPGRVTGAAPRAQWQAWLHTP